MRSSLLAALTLTVLGAASAQTLKVTEPRTAHWWIAESLNTLSWSADSGAPQQFSVFLNNPDAVVLTSKYALISVQPQYEFSKTVNPGKMTPATGYTIELTDILNSSNIYATSETFEIKAVNSAYPPQDDASSASGASQSGVSATMSGGSASQSAAAPSSTGGAHTTTIPGLVGAAVAFGGLALVL